MEVQLLFDIHLGSSCPLLHLSTVFAGDSDKGFRRELKVSCFKNVYSVIFFSHEKRCINRPCSSVYEYIHLYYPNSLFTLSKTV